jgi:hypothetical protein
MPHSLRVPLFLKHSKKISWCIWKGPYIYEYIPPLFKGYEADSLGGAMVLYKSYTSLSECKLPQPHISPMSLAPISKFLLDLMDL